MYVYNILCVYNMYVLTYVHVLNYKVNFWYTTLPVSN